MSLRVAIQGWGSEGDLRPLVALAAALQDRGHRAHLDLCPIDGADYAPLCKALGLPLHVVPERLDVSLDRVARDAQQPNPLAVSRELVERAFFPHLAALHQAALEACAQSDLVVWHYASWYAKAAALEAGIPDVAVHFFPGLVPSRHAPPAGLPDLGPLNRVLWGVARVALDLQFRKRPARFFAQRGLPPVRHVLPDILFAEQLNLHAFSRVLVPPAPDWGGHHQVCGQWLLPSTAEAWQPSPELTAFLGRGPKPVLLSLGSMEHLAPERARALLVGGARAAGVRAIVQSKRTAVEGADGDLYFLPWAPHSLLLPHCAAMVHHGGAGTTHSALRAQLPAVVVPFILEQQVWGERLRRAGAAARALPFFSTTEAKLGQAIRHVLETEALSARARELGTILQEEDGARTAVALLEGVTPPRACPSASASRR